MIVAGFGLRAEAGVASLRDALLCAQDGHPPVTAIAAPEDRIAAPAALAVAMGLPLLPVYRDVLEGVETITRSPVSIAARGTGSVAEAAALVAAGPGARLIATRHISADRMATCAIAEGSEP